MTVRKYSSISQETSLTSALNSSATTMVVGSASGLFGGITIASGETFTVVIDPDTALEEIVDVIYPSSSASNTLTITRAVETGSSAIAHSAGAKVRHMAIGRDFREANTHIENTTTAHGLTLANVVTTTGTQTLTNKTLTSPTITGTGAIAGTFTGNLTGNVTGNVSGTSGSTTGNAATATALATGRTFQLTGDVEASGVTFDGTGNVSLTTVIGTGAIVNADINASAAIDKTKISGTAITAADTGTVTSAMITDGTIVNADVSATAAIAKTKLDLGGTITSADLVDGTIVNSDINASAGIALSKLATDPLARANHTGTQTASTISDFDTQVRSSRLDQMAAPTAAVALNAQKITGLADPTNAQDAVTLNYITTQKGVANGIAELDGSGLVPTHHLPALAITTTQVVNSQAAMLALTAQTGDVAVRTDVNKSFILTATPASTLGNWQELLTPTDSVLSVDGSTGAVSLSGTYLNRTTGQLLGALNANAFKITNLGTPTATGDAATKDYVDAVAGSATAAAASAAAAATTYDNFDDRYLGAKATPPTLDNDGNALITGAIYWDSTSNAMFAWSGSAWTSISSTAAIYRYRFNATGGETSVSGADANGLTLSYLPGKAQVYLNGVLLIPTTDYTASNGTSITSLAALAAGDVLEVITFTAFELVSAIEETIFDAKGDLLVGTAADTAGKLTVGTNGYYLQADSTTATGLKWAQVSGALAQPTEPASPSDGQIWIDTDGTAPTTVVTRWTKQPAAGTTSLTGNDDYSIPLAYSAGYEQVFLNGVLLSRSGGEYTATNGTSITLTSATVAGDIVEVICPLQIATTDTYTQSAVNNAFVANTGYFAAGKNKIINGDFYFNQRNFTSTTTSSYGFDRWRYEFSTGTNTYSAQTFTPGTAPVAGYEGKNFAQMDITGQSATSAYNILGQRVEDVRTFAGQTVTLSFWAKASSGTPKIGLEITQVFGSGGSPSAFVSTPLGSITTSTSWVRYSKTIAVPSISGKTIGTDANSSFIEANLWLSAGSDYNTRASSIGINNSTFQIWGVQLEAGSTATAFQTATGSIQGELAACQRYYFRFTGPGAYSAYAFGAYGGTTTGYILMDYPVTLRTTPSSLDYANLAVQLTDGGGPVAVTNLALDQNSLKNQTLLFTVGTAGTAFRPCRLLNNNNAAGYVGLSAEL